MFMNEGDEDWIAWTRVRMAKLELDAKAERCSSAKLFAQKCTVADGLFNDGLEIWWPILQGLRHTGDAELSKYVMLTYARDDDNEIDVDFVNRQLTEMYGPPPPVSDRKTQWEAVSSDETVSKRSVHIPPKKVSNT
ncbi:hypothetical protein SARC_13988 [Sphaeroforma arctica JP610]|uniref:Uncharacterized protein n=1 Tax=Sphaeroforma arctica JP610 TaxID=667725 RepID=A0A0L0FA90_9EUKA|nr:hypothetical protein SARC_13988 [Sphaeroforma arctica JP610]KNC73451.1 hypothetical protein SARC_13988 [Sphaeroforma arctica JP610]|eukprot:XP_014147353.1 hypothetical protein SARC_13988 [Sphaeroforma arctica JP610]